MNPPRTVTSRPSCTLARMIALCLVLATVLALPAVSRADSCPNAVFRNGPSSRLPDCRAYEMVTPPYKEAFPVSYGGPGSHVAEGGDQVLGESIGVFAGTEDDLFDFDAIGQLLGADYLFMRGGSGWSPVAIDPPAAQYPLGGLLAVSSELTESLWAAATTAQAEATRLPNEEATSQDFYVRSLNGPVVEVGPILPPGVGTAGLAERYAEFGGASSSDLSAVLFSMRERHWPGDATEPGAESLYEYVGTGNSAPLLVGVSGGEGSTSLISRCGTELAFRPASTEEGSHPSYEGAVSVDGGVVFFTAAACGASPAVAELFARVDNGQPSAETVAISEPSVEDCPLCDTEAGVLAGATFQGASADGSKVFFTTSQPLLGGDVSDNLYEYDFQAPVGPGDPSGRVVRVSAGDSTVTNPTAGVERVLYVSPDGSHVYFTASGVLTRTPNSIGQEAEAGRSNLYLYERDSEYPGGRTVFVMPDADVIASAYGVEGGFAGGVHFSQNGVFLAFKSLAYLTSDDLSSVPQGFEYDSQSGGFARYSVGEGGFNDDGNTGTPTVGQVADDGSVYFDSANPLVPAAVSGKANVYEYREGGVSLISSGQDTRGAELAFISPSGDDVFFHTFDQLVSRDTDSQEDLYDARVDGGFAEPPPPPPCEADACQGQLSGAPVLLSPGSEFQAGGENVASTATETTTTPKLASKHKAKTGRQRKRRRKARKSSRGGRGAGGGRR